MSSHHLQLAEAKCNLYPVSGCKSDSVATFEYTSAVMSLISLWCMVRNHPCDTSLHDLVLPTHIVANCSASLNYLCADGNHDLRGVALRASKMLPVLWQGL